MINAERSLAAVAVERLAGQVLAALDLIITIRITPAGDADAQVSVLAQSVRDTQFRIQIGWSDCQTQRQIRTMEIVGFIQVIKGIRRQRGMSHQGGVIAELEQFTPDGINLPEHRATAEETSQPEQQGPSPKGTHAHCLAQKAGRGKWVKKGLRESGSRVILWSTSPVVYLQAYEQGEEIAAHAVSGGCSEKDRALLQGSIGPGGNEPA